MDIAFPAVLRRESPYQLVRPGFTLLLALRAFVAESELLVDPADDADAEQAMNTIVQKAKQMKEAAETHADHMKAFIKRSKALF